jgi:hypothetical protein
MQTARKICYVDCGSITQVDELKHIFYHDCKLRIVYTSCGLGNSGDVSDIRKFGIGNFIESEDLVEHI